MSVISRLGNVGKLRNRSRSPLLGSLLLLGQLGCVGFVCAIGHPHAHLCSQWNHRKMRAFKWAAGIALGIDPEEPGGVDRAHSTRARRDAGGSIDSSGQVYPT